MRTPPRHLLALVVAALLLGAATAAAATRDTAAPDAATQVPGRTTGQLVTSPARQVASVGPGKYTSFPMIVQNRLGRTAQVEVQTWDMKPGSKTYSSLAKPGSTPRGAGDWLVPEAARFTLRDGERRTFQVRVNAPTTAGPGGHYGAVTVTALRDQAQDTPVGVDVRIATNVTVLVPGGVTYDGRVSDVRLSERSDGRVRVRFRIKATGNIQTRPRARVTLTGRFGAREAVSVKVPEILPGGSRTITTSVAAPARFGPVDASVRVRFEDRSTTTAESDETLWLLPPTWLVALVLGAIVAVVSIVVIAVRRRNLRILLERYGDEAYEDDSTPEQD